MVNHIHYNLNANEDFLLFFLLPSLLHALLTFIWMLSISLREWKPINCLFTKEKQKYIYQILGFQGEVHSIWDLWTTNLQECKDDSFFVFLKYRAGRVKVVNQDKIKRKTWWGCWEVPDRGPWPWDPSPHEGHDLASWGPPKWHEL